MPRWSVNQNGKVVQCKSSCTLDHEHYLGSYERAVKYFGMDQEEQLGYGNLNHIVLAHQTMPQFAPKLSNELYEILMDAQSQQKYWAPPQERHDRAMKALEDGEKLGVIKDEQLCERLMKSGRMNSQKRVYMYRKWLQNL